MNAVLVINADLGPLHRVSVKHAIRMLCRKVAEIHEAEPDIRLGVYPLPRVVRLINYVVTKWRYSTGPAWSRSGVLARDHYQCAYCGRKAETITARAEEWWPRTDQRLAVLVPCFNEETAIASVVGNSAAAPMPAMNWPAHRTSTRVPVDVPTPGVRIAIASPSTISSDRNASC